MPARSSSQGRGHDGAPPSTEPTTRSPATPPRAPPPPPSPPTSPAGARSWLGPTFGADAAAPRHARKVVPALHARARRAAAVAVPEPGGGSGNDEEGDPEGDT